MRGQPGLHEALPQKTEQSLKPEFMGINPTILSASSEGLKSLKIQSSEIMALEMKPILNNDSFPLLSSPFPGTL